MNEYMKNKQSTENIVSLGSYSSWSKLRTLWQPFSVLSSMKVLQNVLLIFYYFAFFQYIFLFFLYCLISFNFFSFFLIHFSFLLCYWDLNYLVQKNWDVKIFKIKINAEIRISELILILSSTKKSWKNPYHSLSFFWSVKNTSGLPVVTCLFPQGAQSVLLFC